MTRWMFPICVVWGQFFLSAFVLQRRLPAAVQASPSRLLVGLLLGVPLASLALLWVCRRLDRDPAKRSPEGDMIVLWFLGFGFSVHAILLANTLGMIPSLHPVLSFATGGLLLGLSLLFPGLSRGSPFGVTHPRALGSDDAWRKTHRRLAYGCLTSGLLAIGLAPFVPSAGMIVACVPVVGVLVGEAASGGRGA